jgi:hypothetical protein
MLPDTEGVELRGYGSGAQAVRDVAGSRLFELYNHYAEVHANEVDAPVSDPGVTHPAGRAGRQ